MDIEKLDDGIRDIVFILRSNGVETFESCQGGPGHHFKEPTVRFHGGHATGPLAAGHALTHGLPVLTLRRYWNISQYELDGPYWEMTFYLGDIPLTPPKPDR